MGATINARMGLNTWAAFFGTDANAEIAGDVAMLSQEVTPVLKALRANGLNVVAIHNHMTGGQPTVYFLHYWGTGPVEKLASGFKAALRRTRKGHIGARRTLRQNNQSRPISKAISQSNREPQLGGRDQGRSTYSHTETAFLKKALPVRFFVLVEQRRF